MNYVQRNVVPLVVGLVAIAAITVSTAVIVDQVRADHHDHSDDNARFEQALGQLGQAFQSAAQDAVLGVQVDDSLKVTTVQPGSAAQQAGVQVGDRIVAVDGHDVHSLADIRSQLADVAADSDYRLQIDRNGQTMTLTAHKAAAGDEFRRFLEQMPQFGQRFGEHARQPDATPQPPSTTPTQPAPTPAPPTAQGPRLGMSVVQVTGGLRVLSVEAGSAAEAAGVQANDVVTAANGQPTPTIVALQHVLQAAGAGGDVTLTATRAGATVTLTAHLGQGTSGPAASRQRPAA